ncbi:hypothetical protein [Paraburkholderia humisilvae]|uniref:hypothetical protein n=1 Tax=Paraburkholderia humisilvae TaxID=627669 RepID=UPI00361013FD
MDDHLCLLTPLFSDGTGLGKFKEQFANALNLTDENVPSDAAVHAQYHDAIEAQILTEFGDDLRGKTINANHGHFPLPGTKDAFTARVFEVAPKLQIFTRQERQTLIGLTNWG